MNSSGRDGSAGGDKSKKASQLVRVHPRYIRIRQGSEFSYHVKLLRPPSKGKGVTVHVCVVNNKCGITVQPTQLVITASDWRQPREVTLTCELEADTRTIQIYHKIYENYDDVYSSSTIVPSVFVSVLQKEATFLFAFGCGLHGRLGTSAEANANAPTPFACKWLHPVQIACGKTHSAIIDVYSNIYCFGNNASGQLGQGDNKPSKIPLRVPSVGTSMILQVACGSNHTMCLTTEGKIFTWGDNTCGQLGIGAKSTKPRGIPTRVEKIINVRALFCGGNQSFLVTLDNNVLAAGSNIAGQLGFGDREDRATFERIQFFRKHYANLVGSNSREQLTQAAAVAAMPFGDVELACGLYHTMALCAKRVYSWGNGEDGRLGLGGIDTVLEPTLVQALKDVPIKQIACGGSHSGAVSITHNVYMWGCGQYGQVGHGTTRNRRLPTKVRLLQNKNVVQLSLGEWHSIALCGDGALYAWGFGEEGQLGLPEDTKQHGTRIVPLPAIVSAMSGTGATTVRCGGAHTFVVSVLESRRPQLANQHRRASQIEILDEISRLAKLERQRSRKGPTHSIEPLIENDAEFEEHTRSVTESMTKLVLRQLSAKSKKKIRPSSPPSLPKATLYRIHEPCAEAPPRGLEFSWKERPLSSRTSVRNALRQDMRLVSGLKQILTPRNAPPSSLRSQSARTAFVSPRLKRLHEQVVRASEAGSVFTRTRALVGTEDTKIQINAAVDQATNALLRPQRLRSCTSVRHHAEIFLESPRDETISGKSSPSLLDSEDQDSIRMDIGVTNVDINRRWSSRTTYVMED